MLALLPLLLPLLTGTVKSFELFGAKVELLETKLSSQGRLLKVLHHAAVHSLTEFEYNHLLALDVPEQYVKYSPTRFLQPEMIRLCQHGFVKEVKGGSVWTIPLEGEQPFNIKNHVVITTKGQDHIRLINELAAVGASKP